LKIYKTKIKGLVLIKQKKYFDKRGYFFETYNNKIYSKIGISEKFLQDNFSISKKNVLRGLHYQNKNPQGKLISVVKGSILDIAVDIRKGSKTYGKYQAFILSEENCKQLWIPKNFAHGFLTLSSNTIVNYKCTELYDPHDQNTIIWNDEDLNIDWQIKKPLISKKDENGFLFKDLS
jgi:dTDP-4-dehydrorhamnose 3,5-epimerase